MSPSVTNSPCGSCGQQITCIYMTNQMSSIKGHVTNLRDHKTDQRDHMISINGNMRNLQIT